MTRVDRSRGIAGDAGSQLVFRVGDMKRLAFGVALAFLVAGSPAAGRPVSRVSPVAAAFSWTGCYVGGHVGGIRNDSSLSSYATGTGVPAAQTVATSFSYSADHTSFTGGVQYGCNYQTGNWVFGLDSSFSWAGIDQTISVNHPGVPALAAYTETVSQRLDWYSTTRARIGWAHDRWMVFVAGGLATGRVKSSFTADFTLAFPQFYTGSGSETRYGWTLGGGLEYALSQNWFLRGEYLYVDLGDFNYISTWVGAAPSVGRFVTDVDTKFHVARLALSYRFTGAPSLLQWAIGGFKD
jgi:outer membrane immunogenic protein